MEMLSMESTSVTFMSCSSIRCRLIWFHMGRSLRDFGYLVPGKPALLSTSWTAKALFSSTMCLELLVKMAFWPLLKQLDRQSLLEGRKRRNIFWIWMEFKWTTPEPCLWWLYRKVNQNFFFFFFAFQPPSKVQEAVVFCIQTEENLWNLWDKRAAWCQSGK